MAGRDQSAADQPNNLAKGHPPTVTIVTIILLNKINIIYIHRPDWLSIKVQHTLTLYVKFVNSVKVQHILPKMKIRKEQIEFLDCS